MSKREDFRNLTQQKAAMRAALASAPTGTLVKSLARNTLPETMGEAIVEGSIAVTGGIGTFIAVGTVMPAVLAAGGAVVAAAAYNAKVHDDGEIRELLGRVKKFAWPGKKNEVGDKPPQSVRKDTKDILIEQLNARLDIQAKQIHDLMSNGAPPLETEDPQNLDIAQWAKEGEVK